MVKECPVTLNNEYFTVVSFDGTEIQFPAIHKRAKTVFVEKQNGKYAIVEKPKTEPVKQPVAKKRKQQNRKKSKQSEPIVTDNIE